MSNMLDAQNRLQKQAIQQQQLGKSPQQPPAQMAGSPIVNAANLNAGAIGRSPAMAPRSQLGPNMTPSMSNMQMPQMPQPQQQQQQQAQMQMQGQQQGQQGESSNNDILDSETTKKMCLAFDMLLEKHNRGTLNPTESVQVSFCGPGRTQTGTSLGCLGPTRI